MKFERYVCVCGVGGFGSIEGVGGLELFRGKESRYFPR